MFSSKIQLGKKKHFYIYNTYSEIKTLGVNKSSAEFAEGCADTVGADLEETSACC